MGKFIDITGQKFGRLTVVRKSGRSKSGHVMWECCCDCGAKRYVPGAYLRNGHTKSCGCYQADIVRESAKKMGTANKRHGMSHDRLHHIWTGMKQRCADNGVKDYQNYGGRGITVCQEWRDSFEAFRDWSLANGYRDDLTIDRINVNGGYEPENCRWITMEQQQRNRTNSRFLTFNGETHTLAEWAEITGIRWGTIKARLNSGWTTERTLTEPVHTK